MKKIIKIVIYLSQLSFYYLITPISFLVYRNKFPWLICERGNDARDNGYTFFKYLHDEQIGFINAYYLINKNSADYIKVRKLGNTVRYKSLKHWLLYRAAECRMSTHLSAFAPGNYIGEWFKHHKQSGINVFLQHGITHNEFPSNYYEHNGSDLFICGAKPEYDHISSNCHYPLDNVVYTGFSRFDFLHNIKTNKQILVMPTWRQYLSGLTKEEFKQSLYYKSFDDLLSNKKLNERLEREGITIYFYIHYDLQPYIDCFNKNGSNIVIADFNHYDVQTLLKESKLLITDYSSVFFDFSYMKKPVIYYQFDVSDFYGMHYKRCYYNHENDGFGEVIKNEDNLLNVLFEYIDNNFKLKDMYKKKIEEFFPLYDSNNSKRIFTAIINKYIDKKKYPDKRDNKKVYLSFTGDDYGRNNQSNQGINEAYRKGFIQQTSLIVNRGEDDQIGIDKDSKIATIFHFNILEGDKTYDPNGKWYFFVDGNTIARRIVKKNSFIKINKEDSKIIDSEITNQINRYSELGYKCLAFDSHGHMHNRYPIAKILIPKCKKAGFKVARIPMNIKHRHVIFDLTYKKYITHIYRKNFITTNYFCSCYDLIHINLNKYKNRTIEIMTHPFLFDYGVENRRDIPFESIQKYISHYNIKLINYNDLVAMHKK